MKICIDDKIPYIKGVLEPYAEVEYLPGGLASPGKLRHADALIIRTRTLCNELTLAHSKISFIATATIGYDHIDTDFCQRRAITWTNAAGCNADSVAMYIVCALKQLAKNHHFNLQDQCLGIVGLGHVGEKVAAVASQLGCRVLKNDPLRQSAMLEGKTCSDNGLPYTDRAEDYISLDELMARADIISLHPNLHYETPYASYHLFDEKRLSQMQAHQILINASRGEVVDYKALKEALKAQQIKAAVLDVWENEPNLDRELLDWVEIATPHIAGYAIDGKARGTEMSVQALARHFGITELYDWKVESLPSHTAPYDILLDDAALRQAPEQFEELRAKSAITKVLSHCSW